MSERQWLPNYAELIDRLSIHQLKEIFIPEHKEKYRQEMEKIVHDINLLSNSSNVQISGELIRAIIIIAQINTHIWYNESKARSGQEQDLHLLRLTHGLNGIRNNAGNFILNLVGDIDRYDYKTDCLAAENSQWEIEMPRDK